MNVKLSKLYFPLALAVGILSAHFAFLQQFTSTGDALILGVGVAGLVSAVLLPIYSLVGAG